MPLVCRGCVPQSPEYTDDVHVAEPTSARALPSAFAATHKKGTNEFSVEWGHIRVFPLVALVMSECTL